MGTSVPEPQVDERATVFADRIGQWYCSRTSLEHRKANGLFLTPPEVADFMAGLLDPKPHAVRILDPGAGAGILTCAVCEYLAAHRTRPSEIIVQAYETDKDLIKATRAVLQYLKICLEKKGILVRVQLDNCDFILSHAGSLNDHPTLFEDTAGADTFDIAVSNPPYFKIPKSDVRAQAASSVVHGQPNVYALFMAISGALLRPGGQMVFITPRSFASGPYFRVFRQQFFSSMKPDVIHLFESRRDTFKRDEVLQENIILKAHKEEAWPKADGKSQVLISSSAGGKDLVCPRTRTLPLHSILDLHSPNKVLRIPLHKHDDDIIRTIDSWPGSLHKYGFEISTGPVVPFRAQPFLSAANDGARPYVPLLWLQNVGRMSLEWPVQKRGKPQFIAATEKSLPLLVPNRVYVVLRRFSAKEEERRLTAAPLDLAHLNESWIGLENHLNFVHRPGGKLAEDEAWGLAVLYNSRYFDVYFRMLNGNTQVSATELRSIPLPPLPIIQAIGRHAKQVPDVVSQVDFLAGLAFPALSTRSPGKIAINE